MPSADIEEYYDKIYRYCYMKLGHRQTAEDLTQETFLRFLETHQYKELGRQLAYLYTIARNLCTDHYRAGSFTRQSALSSEECLETLPQPPPQEYSVTKLTLQQALERLSPEEQELIFLRYINEVSVGQLCSIYHISRFTVYRKIQAALKKLKNHLREEDFYE